MRVFVGDQDSEFRFHITMDTEFPSRTKYYPLFLSVLKVMADAKNVIVRKAIPLIYGKLDIRQ